MALRTLSSTSVLSAKGTLKVKLKGLGLRIDALVVLQPAARRHRRRRAVCCWTDQGGRTMTTPSVPPGDYNQRWHNAWSQGVKEGEVSS